MITIKQLTKKFEQRTVLDKINLTFKEGIIYALIGESGSGKTTLLNIIAKLEPYDSGSIQYQNQDLKHIKPQAYFRDDLGYLFQNFGLIESETVETNLNLGLVGKKLSKAERQQKQRDALKKVNLDYIELKQKIFELSGGESQRVALAKVILKDPPILLADELTAALDPENAEDVMRILKTLKSEKRIIIIATHNPAVWEKADVVIKMHEL